MPRLPVRAQQRAARVAAARRIAAAALLVLSPASFAAAQDDEAGPAPATYIQNCVGDDTVELHAGTDSALLDAADGAMVQAAMRARYRQLAGDGFAPAAIMLWRSPSFGWIYIALNGHPDKPGRLCSAATFSAPVFEFTGTLLRKYFFAGRT